MKITDEMIEEIATKACREASPSDVFAFQASPFSCARIAARMAFEAALSLDEAEAVAWRWRWDEDAPWSHGSERPNFNRRIPDINGAPEFVEPIFTHPSTGTRDEVLRQAVKEAHTALKATECPRPINGHEMAVDCEKAGTCGCCYGEAFRKIRSALASTGGDE